MQHTLTYPPTRSSGLEFTPTNFNVLIVYEDFETGKQAKKTYDLLSENLGRECQCTSQMWKFEVLTIPKLRDIALKDAAMADIVIVSCHGQELPRPVQDWLSSWVSAPANTLALVALLDGASEHALHNHAVRTYLADIARQGGMEFFCQPTDWSASTWRPGTSVQNSAQWRSRTLTTLAGTVQTEVHYPHWGINE